MKTALLRTLFPQSCIGCHHLAHHYLLCQHCENTLERHQRFQINRHQITFYSVFHYSGLIQQLVQLMKFTHDLQCCDYFGDTLSTAIKAHYTKLPQLIIPIPLHNKRLKDRGFNQTVEIAKRIQKNLTINVDKYTFTRHKNTTPQALLPLKERKQNIKNAFTLKKPLKAKHVILLDDVITTGNTIKSALETIQQQGDIQVDIWCCASKA